jgi:hypothetical protein
MKHTTNLVRKLVKIGAFEVSGFIGGRYICVLAFKTQDRLKNGEMEGE